MQIYLKKIISLIFKKFQSKSIRGSLYKTHENKGNSVRQKSQKRGVLRARSEILHNKGGLLVTKLQTKCVLSQIWMEICVNLVFCEQTRFFFCKNKIWGHWVTYLEFFDQKLKNDAVFG